MAKIDELSELMVGELDQFEISLRKLKEMNETGIKVDVSELQKLVVDHQLTIKYSEKLLDKNYEQLKEIISRANIYPKWIVVLFTVSFGFNIIMLVVLFQLLP